MIKKLCIILLSVCTVAPLSAQQYSSSDDASFAPKKGQWQVSMVMGSSQMFNNNTENYLLPTYWNGRNFSFPNVGLGNNTSGNQSSDPATYLQLGDLNSNNLVNIIGIQGKYFLTDCWDVNLMFSMNIGVTPKKDYIEETRRLPICRFRPFNIWKAESKTTGRLILAQTITSIRRTNASICM